MAAVRTPYCPIIDTLLYYVLSMGTSTQNHFQKSFMATSQYWSGINEPKCVFRMTRNVSDEVLRNLKKNYFSEFSTFSLLVR